MSTCVYEVIPIVCRVIVFVNIINLSCFYQVYDILFILLVCYIFIPLNKDIQVVFVVFCLSVHGCMWIYIHVSSWHWHNCQIYFFGRAPEPGWR